MEDPRSDRSAPPRSMVPTAARYGSGASSTNWDSGGWGRFDSPSHVSDRAARAAARKVTLPITWATSRETAPASIAAVMRPPMPRQTVRRSRPTVSPDRRAIRSTP